jgi:hypothetical protein
MDSMFGDLWKDDDTCSYCGGTNPEKIIELLKQGWHLTCTDKSYKYYVNQHLDSGGYSQVKLYTQHCTQKQIDEINLIRNGGSA